MTDFSDQLEAFASKAAQRERDVFLGVSMAVLGSIRDGSPITAAAGQPVDTSALKQSWQLTYETDTLALIGSGGAVESYNAVIEYNLRGATLRSKVGGFHSVAATIAGFPRLVEHVRAKVASGGPLNA